MTGTVTLDGTPLAGAIVNFQPIGESRTPGAGSVGRTNDKGEYHLEMVGGGRGAVPGKHQVRVYCPVDDGQNNPDEDRRTKPKDRVPPQYNIQTTLTFEVKPGPNTANWDLTSAGAAPVASRRGT